MDIRTIKLEVYKMGYKSLKSFLAEYEVEYATLYSWARTKPRFVAKWLSTIQRSLPSAPVINEVNDDAN